MDVQQAGMTLAQRLIDPGKGRPRLGRMEIAILAALVLFGVGLAFVLVYQSYKVAFLMLFGLVGAVAFFIRPEIGLLAIVFAIPLEDFNQVSSVGSLSILKLLSLGVLVAYLVHYAGSSREEKLVNVSENIYILLLLLALLISDLVALDPTTAVAMTMKLGRMAILYFLVINIVRSQSTVRHIFWVMVIVGVFSAGYGLYEYSFQPENVIDMRITGTLDDPMGFSYSMVVLLPVIWYLFTHQSSSLLKRVFLVGAGGLFLYGIILSGTRSGILAAAGVLVLIAIRQKHALLNLTLIAGIIIASLIWMPEQVKSRFGLSDQVDKAAESSTERRVTYYAFGLEVFLQSPFIGSGMGGFTEAYSHSDYQYMLYEGDAPRIAHDMYLEILTGAGLLGLIPFLLILIVPVIKLERLIRDPEFRSWGELGRIIQINLIAFIFIGLFSSSQYDKPLWLMISLGAVLPVIARRNLVFEESDGG